MGQDKRVKEGRGLGAWRLSNSPANCAETLRESCSVLLSAAISASGSCVCAALSPTTIDNIRRQKTAAIVLVPYRKI